MCSSTCRKKRAKLHLLQGLGKILLDIDRAIAIIRNTEREADVVPNLMAGFGLDEVQANFVAEIKLRNINREYILKRTAETDALEKDIADLEATLESKRRIRGIIIRELRRRSSAGTRRRGARASSRRSPSRRCRPRTSCRITRCSCSSRARAISRRSHRSRCA